MFPEQARQVGWGIDAHGKACVQHRHSTLPDELPGVLYPLPIGVIDDAFAGDVAEQTRQMAA